ncbi:MAG TPA: hypothetical protein VHI52_08615 [Verrucomicrobiae bacterium]|nr:hypothetical protein [Verrucomicrobiae bacterium]
MNKSFLTVVGEVEVSRRYYHCKKCGRSCMPLDAWAGLRDGMSTPGARRMLSLAGMSWSFDTASDRLAELCLLKVSNDTIRTVSEEEGQAAQQWIKESSRPAEVFKQAKGEAEFYTDGVTVNTTKGWRDLRLNVMDKREAGLGVTPRQWADSGRVLPEPSVRIAWGSLAPSEKQGRMWKAMAGKLGVVDDERLSVLADGQRWIWDQAALCWKKAQWVLDVFHVSEHIHDCGKILFGESSPHHQPWAENQVLQLIEQGPVQYVQKLKQLLAKQTAPERIKAIQSLLGYLESNIDSLWYAQRLAAGRPIGTGLIEGGCKTIVSNRLKLNNARWTAKHAEEMASLRCLDYSGLWAEFWIQRAA